jgi:fibronectin type 3 domain-containing protein
VTSTVTAYRVYYGTASGSYQQQRGAGISAGSSTAYTATGLNAGTQYYFAVTAIDNAGNESAFSNEATKLVQ